MNFCLCSSRQSAAVVRTLLINFVHHDVAPPADIRMTRSGVFSSISSAACELCMMYVLQGCVSQYTRLLYWRDASHDTLDYCIGGMHLTVH